MQGSVGFGGAIASSLEGDREGLAGSAKPVDGAASARVATIKNGDVRNGDSRDSEFSNVNLGSVSVVSDEPPSGRKIGAGHSREPSESTYSFLDFYTSNGSPPREDESKREEPVQEEPFLVVSKRGEEPDDARLGSTKAIPKRTESLMSTRTSRNSAERIRSNIESDLKSSSASHLPSVKNTGQLKRTSFLTSDRDRYGFKKTSNHISESKYNAWWKEYSVYVVRRKMKWEKFMNKSGLSGHSSGASFKAPSRFPPKSDDLKRFVRKGIPAEWRGNAWFYFAKGPEKLKENKGKYDRLVEETLNLVNENTEAIEKDLHRTFPDNIYFTNKTSVNQETGLVEESESPLIQSLRRVLYCFSQHNPAIGYCQSMNFIVGLLLIFMEEEKAFWMLVIITERLLPGIHDINLEGVSVHQGVLLTCIKQYLPQVWTVINSTIKDKQNTDILLDLPPLSFCTTSWFMSIFIGVLPIESTLRVWDCLFYEDTKTLFRISLAIFKILEPSLISAAQTAKSRHRHSSRSSIYSNDSDDADMVTAELFQLIQNTPKTLLDANSLMETCFKKYNGFGHVSQDEINNCKKYVANKRQRYHEMIQKRTSAFGSDVDRRALSEEERRRLLAESMGLYADKKVGLRASNWNGRLSGRVKRIQSRLS
ncbi:unnamed protein product [Kuraishia capsulata CBS 1993]|uniref:Rab-GAP TBC domain-containing protein n=1 Tax=Kuraishia capsulata CBS 1993 TaxID=1382522 RepID=W6MQL6_9ASCO|nr:uncharacterized protein KUCA_T00004962001 [Kuraishia capsulata CBS 1993]CDK28976.1 unnamed protein product [Kuraishia capsulata CBS 1993]